MTVRNHNPVAAFRHLSDYHLREEIDGHLKFVGFRQEREDLDELRFAYYSALFIDNLASHYGGGLWMLWGIRKERFEYQRLSQGITEPEI